MPEKPSITVCMPVYNSASYIAEAINSVLGQSCSDFELLIIDDGSSDGTAEIAAAFAAKDERIRFRSNAVNIGMVSNWNLCMAEASGKYLKFLFGDDVLAPEALNRMVAILEENPDVSLVASGRNLIDKASRVTEQLVHFASGSYEGGEVIRRCVFEQLNLVGEPSAVMFRKAQAGRGFDPAYKQMVDLEMWYHLLEQGRFAYIAEPLCSFRLHSEQQTRKNEKHLLNFSEFFALSAAHLEKTYMGVSRWGARRFLFERYYTFWKIFRKQPEFRQIAAEIVWRQYGKGNFYAMMFLYKIYNPVRKLVKVSSR